MTTDKQHITLYDRVESVLFYSVLLVHLLPILLTIYFVTSDGPCHLYNAGILRDWLLHRDVDFYKQFYSLNHHIDPNWFSHIALAGLLSIFSPVVSEKIFLGTYIISFMLAVRLLVRQISPANSWLSFLAFPFIYSHIFQMGFYNYCYSLVLMIVCIWFYLRYIGKLPMYLFIAVGTLLFLLCFIAHPIGYIILLGTLLGVVFFQYLSLVGEGKQQFSILVRKIGIALVLNAVPMVLLFLFWVRKTTEHYEANTDPFDKKWQSFIHLQSIVNFSNRETDIVSVLPYLFGVLIVVCLFLKLRSKRLSAYDFFFGVAMGLVYYYFHAPNTAMGGSSIAIRVQYLPFLMLLFWLASVPWHSSVRWLSIAAMSVLCAGLIALKLPAHIAASGLVSEYMTALPYIAPHAVVLPLSYSHQGKNTDGNPIADRAHYFLHAADYMGATQPLILLDNYEGDTGYFPLLWLQNKNPFQYLSTHEGQENLPPSVAIAAYESKSSVSIDYILLLCLDHDFIHHPYTLNLLSQLTTYDLIYTSAYKRVLLYKKR